MDAGENQADDPHRGQPRSQKRPLPGDEPGDSGGGADAAKKRKVLANASTAENMAGKSIAEGFGYYAGGGPAGNSMATPTPLGGAMLARPWRGPSRISGRCLRR